MRDPSREELIEYLERSYPRVTCGETVHPEGIAGLLLDASSCAASPKEAQQEPQITREVLGLRRN